MAPINGNVFIADAMNAPAPWFGTNGVADSVPVGSPALIMRTAFDAVRPRWFGGAVRSRIMMSSISHSSCGIGTTSDSTVNIESKRGRLQIGEET
jgi:hypothetical protein